MGWRRRTPFFVDLDLDLDLPRQQPRLRICLSEVGREGQLRNQSRRDSIGMGRRKVTIEERERKCSVMILSVNSFVLCKSLLSVELCVGTLTWISPKISAMQSIKPSHSLLSFFLPFRPHFIPLL